MGKHNRTIRLWLETNGITHEQAARKLGVPVRTFQAWLYGNRRPAAAGRALIKIHVTISDQ